MSLRGLFTRRHDWPETMMDDELQARWDLYPRAGNVVPQASPGSAAGHPPALAPPGGEPSYVADLERELDEQQKATLGFLKARWDEVRVEQVFSCGTASVVQTDYGEGDVRHIVHSILKPGGEVF